LILLGTWTFMGLNSKLSKEKLIRVETTEKTIATTNRAIITF
jgi:hypothetical protein